MLQFLKRTVLYKRFAEVLEARSSLRRLEHRKGLRLKRLAVRAHVYSEMFLLQSEKVRLQKECIQASSGSKIIANALNAHEGRINHLVERFEAVKVKPPTELIIMQTDLGRIIDRYRDATKSNGESKHDQLNSMKTLEEKVMKTVQNFMPNGTPDLGTKHLVTESLKDSMGKASFDGNECEAESASKLISSIVKELNMSKKEVEELVTQVEGGSRSPALRAVVDLALEDAGPEGSKSNKQDQQK